MKANVRTHSPLFYIHCDMDASASLMLGIKHKERAISVAMGAVEIHGKPIAPGQMAVLSDGKDVRITATAPSAVWRWEANLLASVILEFRLIFQGSYRAGEGGLETGTDKASVEDAEFTALPKKKENRRP
jgi:hypothetical protein